MKANPLRQSAGLCAALALPGVCSQALPGGAGHPAGPGMGRAREPEQSFG